MDNYTYILKQRLKNGALWASVPHDGSYRDVCKTVIAGYLNGEPRWAETAETGMFLFGIDRLGKPHKTGTGSVDFSE